MTCDGTIWIRPCDSGCEGVAGADSFYLGSAQDEAFIMTSAAFLFAPIFFVYFISHSNFCISLYIPTFSLYIIVCQIVRRCIEANLLLLSIHDI